MRELSSGELLRFYFIATYIVCGRLVFLHVGDRMLKLCCGELSSRHWRHELRALSRGELLRFYFIATDIVCGRHVFLHVGD